MEGYKKVELQSLANLQKEAIEAKKFVLLWDKTGNADTFFSYNANLVDFNRDVKKVNDEVQTELEALEKLRVKMIPSMRTGKIFAINLTTYMPDFNTQFAGSDDVFPSAKVFSWDDWHVHETYMKCVRDDENHNDMGNKGAFYMDDKFIIVICAKYESDAKCEELCTKIPHHEQFLKYIVS